MTQVSDEVSTGLVGSMQLGDVVDDRKRSDPFAIRRDRHRMQCKHAARWPKNF